MAEIQVKSIEFTPESERKLKQIVRDALKPEIDAHGVRRKWYQQWRQAYKAKPKEEVKSFPWPGASNVVVPVIGITVDAIVARLLRGMLGSKDFCEVEIKSALWESVDAVNPKTQQPIKIDMENEVRDWITNFVKESGARDKIRAVCHDIALFGDGYVKPLWEDVKRTYHGYNAAGQVIEMPVPLREGVVWHVPAPDDIIPALGFDEWKDLPHVSNVIRYTWAELKKLVEGSTGYINIDALGQAYTAGQQKQIKEKDAKVRDDERHVDASVDPGPAQIFDIYEISGEFPIETISADQTGATQVNVTYEQVILSYSYDHDVLIRAIYNPFFGKPQMLVRIPFMVIPHELHGYGIAEQIMQFQEEASTSHNQVVDAGTVANAGIIAVSPSSNVGQQQEIYPGKKIVTPEPGKDVAVYHLGTNSSVLGMMEDKAIRYAESRSGVSAYHLGMESTVVGSRATATGTTALIGEGNLRFWMSIDDIRHAIEELLYLTIQLEQQMRPGGYEWAEGRFIKFPQGDVRTSIGLQLYLTSEKINRDSELQQLMLLMQVLNEYYMRLMQAAAIVANPMFPPVHKMVAVQVMEASQKLVQKFAERYDIENLQEIVPNLMDTLNSAMVILNGIPGMAGPAANQPQLPPAQGTPQPGGGGGQPPGPEGQGGGGFA